MKWIKTSERLPEEGLQVLFVDYRSVQHCGYFCNLYGLTHDWYSYSKSNWYNGEDITHWMPYPDLPEGSP